MQPTSPPISFSTSSIELNYIMSDTQMQEKSLFISIAASSHLPIHYCRSLTNPNEDHIGNQRNQIVFTQTFLQLQN